jgi:hypothetical protein
MVTAGSIGQRDLGYPSPVTNNRDRILASCDAIGDGLRNGNLPALVECAACTRDEAAGARILFGFGGERSQAFVLLAGEHHEFIPMRGPDELHLGDGSLLGTTENPKGTPSCMIILAFASVGMPRHFTGAVCGSSS